MSITKVPTVGKAVASWVKRKFKPKKVADTITSVKPKLTKGDSLEVLRHKTKMSFKKATDDITDTIRGGTNKIIKSLDKMKDPKK
jgi:hypothetical protein